MADGTSRLEGGQGDYGMREKHFDKFISMGNLEFRSGLPTDLEF